MIYPPSPSDAALAERATHTRFRSHLLHHRDTRVAACESPCTRTSPGQPPVIAATTIGDGVAGGVPISATSLKHLVRSGPLVEAPGTLDFALQSALPGIPQPSPRSSSCYRCPSFTQQVGNRCLECPDGMLADFTGSCAFNCPLGYPRQYGQDDCTPCPVGTVEQSGSCKACEEGHYSSSVGGVQCFDCFPGSFANRTGSAQCLPCSAGSYSSERGAHSCTLCPAGGERLCPSLSCH